MNYHVVVIFYTLEPESGSGLADVFSGSDGSDYGSGAGIFHNMFMNNRFHIFGIMLTLHK